MFKTYVLSAFTAALAFAAVPNTASAGKGHRFDVCEAVACTDTQAQQIQTFKDAKKAAVKPIRELSKEVRAQLRAEEAKANPDGARLEALRAELETLRAQSKQHREAYFTKVKQVLTPEQVAKLEQMKAEHKKNFKGKKKGKGKGKHRA